MAKDIAKRKALSLEQINQLLPGKAVKPKTNTENFDTDKKECARKLNRAVDKSQTAQCPAFLLPPLF
jgi:hypothetical protein